MKQITAFLLPALPVCGLIACKASDPVSEATGTAETPSQETPPEQPDGTSLLCNGASSDPARNAGHGLPIANAASGQPDSLNSKTLPSRERFLSIQSAFILLKNAGALSSILLWWAGMDSNHRSLTAADLQSAPFSLLGTYPCIGDPSEI